MNTKYMGWKNRDTWNIAVLIGNVEPVYETALQYQNEDSPFEALRQEFVNDKDAPWNSTELDIDALNDLIKGL